MLEILEYDGARYVDSRDVAECIGRRHSDILKTIRITCWQMAGSGIDENRFFREAFYADANGHERPCFLVTKAGCTILCARASWEKGRVLTKAYLEAFDGVATKLPGKDASFKEKVEALGAAMNMDKKMVATILKAVEKDKVGKK